MNNGLPIIVDIKRGLENAPSWDVKYWFARKADSFPSAIIATFNPRAAIAHLDFTHWGEHDKERAE